VLPSAFENEKHFFFALPNFKARKRHQIALASMEKARLIIRPPKEIKEYVASDAR
jgi:hypothetical protein